MIEEARKHGFNQEVKVVVVSKAQPVDLIRDAYRAGIRCFGENYPQEAEEKIMLLSDLPGIEWHMIGHLQSRKCPVIARHFKMIHSVDSLPLSQKLNNACERSGRKLPVLLEMNVGGEASKFGWQTSIEENWSEILPDFERILQLSNLDVLGLMTMPPLSDSAEVSRKYFQKLRKLRDYLVSCFPHNTLPDLSMGTSADYEVAVEEGATYVRIGQAILGPRPNPEIP